MFFNVPREKSGRPGRFCDVIITHCHHSCRGLVISAHSPTQLRSQCNASQLWQLKLRGTAIQCSCHGRLCQENCQQNDYGGIPRSTLSSRQVAKCSASSSLFSYNRSKIFLNLEPMRSATLLLSHWLSRLLGL